MYSYKSIRKFRKMSKEYEQAVHGQKYSNGFFKYEKIL
jgi:hypothetical protein